MQDHDHGTNNASDSEITIRHLRGQLHKALETVANLRNKIGFQHATPLLTVEDKEKTPYDESDGESSDDDAHQAHSVQQLAARNRVRRRYLAGLENSGVEDEKEEQEPLGKSMKLVRDPFECVESVDDADIAAILDRGKSE